MADCLANDRSGHKGLGLGLPYYGSNQIIILFLVECYNHPQPFSFINSPPELESHETSNEITVKDRSYVNNLINFMRYIHFIILEIVN